MTHFTFPKSVVRAKCESLIETIGIDNRDAALAAWRKKNTVKKSWWQRRKPPQPAIEPPTEAWIANEIKVNGDFSGQLMLAKQFLCYCKLPDSPELIDVARNEASYLHLISPTPDKNGAQF